MKRILQAKVRGQNHNIFVAYYQYRNDGTLLYRGNLYTKDWKLIGPRTYKATELYEIH